MDTNQDRWRTLSGDNIGKVLLSEDRLTTLALLCAGAAQGVAAMVAR